MKRKYLAILLMLNLFFMGTILSIPSSILISEYILANRIDKSDTLYCSSTEPLLKKELNLNIDLGQVEINYISQPVDYLMKVDIVIEMGGNNLAGKSYSDFFAFEWQNTSDIVNFTLEIKAGVDLDRLLALIEKINILVTLRADVVCDFNINMKMDGDVKLTVPFKVSVGCITTNITNGDILYNINFGIVGGNITGIIQETGNIEIITTEVEYTQNSTWSLDTYDGDISLQIYQNSNMNANVSGIFSITYGNINFKYRDNNDNSGAYFTLYYEVNDLALAQKISEVVGFDTDLDPEQTIFYLESYDYPAQNNYNLLFYNPNGRYLILDIVSS